MFQVIYCPNNDNARHGSDEVELFNTSIYMDAIDYARMIAAQIMDVTNDWCMCVDTDFDSPFHAMTLSNGETVQVISID